MKLIFIRHGDPDYSIDSLTEKGWKEAECLSKRVAKWKNISEIYVSPLGRAKDTASLSLKALNETAIEKPWLKEFYYQVDTHKENPVQTGLWDFFPETWSSAEYAFDRDNWYKNPLLNNPEVKPAYDEVCKGIDEILKNHGYERKDNIYIRTKEEKDEVIVFFCHLGVSLLILGYLLNMSPFQLWHTFFVAPTSVTILGTEERTPGKAHFRAQVVGDTRHLSDCGEPISKSGYYTDCFQG